MISKSFSSITKKCVFSLLITFLSIPHIPVFSSALENTPKSPELQPGATSLNNASEEIFNSIEQGWDKEAIEFLVIKNPTFLNKRDKNGQTPLDHINNKKELYDVLKRHGAKHAKELPNNTKQKPKRSLDNEPNLIHAIAEEKEEKNNDESRKSYEESMTDLYREISKIRKINKKIVVVIGPAGCGKSTTICDMIGCKMKLFQEETETIDGGEYIDLAERVTYPIPKIGHNMAKSETKMPAVYFNPAPTLDNPTYYCDMPGFKDTSRQGIENIAPLLILNCAPNINALLVLVSYADILSARGDVFTTIIEQIMTYFKEKSWEQVSKSMFVGITRSGTFKTNLILSNIKAHIFQTPIELEYIKTQIMAIECSMNNMKSQKKDVLQIQEKMVNKLEKNKKGLESKAKFLSLLGKKSEKDKTKIIWNEKKILHILLNEEYIKQFLKKNNNNEAKLYKPKLKNGLKESPRLNKECLKPFHYTDHPTFSNQILLIAQRMNRLLSRYKDIISQNTEFCRRLYEPGKIDAQIKELNKKNEKLTKTVEKLKKDDEPQRQDGFLPYTAGEHLATNTASIRAATTAAGSAGIVATVLKSSLVPKEAKKIITGGGAVATLAIAGATYLGTKLYYTPYHTFRCRSYEVINVIKLEFGPGTMTIRKPNWLQIEDPKSIKEGKEVEIKHNKRKKVTIKVNGYQSEPPKEGSLDDLGTMYEFYYEGHCDKECYAEVKLYTYRNQLSSVKTDIEIKENTIQTNKATLLGLTANKKDILQKIKTNNKTLNELNECIRDTRRGAKKPLPMKKNRLKCEMIDFFSGKQLFPSSIEENENEEKYDYYDDEIKENEDEEKCNMSNDELYQLLDGLDRVKKNDSQNHIKQCVKKWNEWLQMRIE